MRACAIGWLAAAGLLAAAPVFAQLPGQTARPVSGPTGGAPARQDLPPPFVTSQRDLEIPFSVKPGDSPASQPAAVRVFVSWDRGKTWHFYDEQQPDVGRFRFQPRQDGEFWFATQTVDRSGQTDSPQPKSPQLRLVIDTQKPQLLAQANVARPGEVTLAWSVADATLSASSLKIEYQDAAGSGGAWHTVEIDPATTKSTSGQLTGRAAFETVSGIRAINLRVEVADAAGNRAFHSQRLSLSPPRVTTPDGIAAAPPPDHTATRWPSGGSQESGGRSRGAEIVREGEAPAEPDARGLVSNPFARQDRLVSSPGASPSAEQLPPPMITGETLPPPAEGGVGRPAPNGGRESGVGSREGEAPAEPFHASESLSPPPGDRPRLCASRRFSLDYDVETVGPEGLADVELWGTSDGGRTWTKWGADPDKQSPFDVEVGGEGAYGFKIVIVGKSGLASTAPQAGEAADIWVGIDLTRPKARLVSAAYGQGDAAGKLDIRWEAADENLGIRPATISIGERPDGAFTPIAAGLPGTGQYYWDFDPRSPRLIYLRLEVRDEAGNTTIDQLTEPIKVEGLQPKGRIRGFLPPTSQTAPRN